MPHTDQNLSPGSPPGLPLEHCAILLLSLGEEVAAAVCKHLSPREVQQLGVAMAGLRQVTRGEVAAVLERFHADIEQFMAVSLGSGDYVFNVLSKALGAEHAAGMMEDILENSQDSAGMEALNWMDPARVAEWVKDEHPQIIATILVHLARDRACSVLGHFTERLRNDVILRIATFGGVQPAAMHELTEVLGDMLVGQGSKRNSMGGVRTAAQIINCMGSKEEEALMAQLREADAELAQRIEDEMFVFENLADLDNEAIQRLIKETDTALLPVALKNANAALRDKFLGNMSSRAAEMLREDLDAQGPVRMSRVEEAQKTILATARRLAEDGQITLGRGEDAYV